MTALPENRLSRFFAFAVVVIGDVVLFNLTFVAAYVSLSVLGQPVQFQTYGEIAWQTILLPPVVFYFAGMYRTWDEYVFSKGADAIWSGVLGALAVLLGVIWLDRESLALLQKVEQGQQDLSEAVWGFPTRVLLIVVLVSPVLIWLWHIAANALEHRFLGWSARVRRIVIVGRMPRSDVRSLMGSLRPRYEVAGVFAQGWNEMDRVPALGGLDDVEARLDTLRLDELFLMADECERGRVVSIVRACFERGVHVRIVPGVYEAVVSATRSDLLPDFVVYGVRGQGISGWTLVSKRLLDVFAAGVALLITSPVVLLACAAIVAESKGWPIFSQDRVGLLGRRFRVFKLRTMVVDADARGGPLTGDDDPRITRVGAFLRRTSIDELPQFWNVLKGDMSLVGPRAVVPYVADQFQEWETLSLLVRPGITGLAQVSGRDQIGFREKSLLNIYYVRNHSIWMDLRILFDTVGVVLTMEGTGGTRGAQDDADVGEGEK